MERVIRMKEIKIKTKRMLLRPLADEEIEALIERTASEELRTAYGEMLDGCRRNPQNRIWYAPWKMELKGNPAFIGDLCFKGPAQNHAVEVGYGILKEYEGNGYTTEALQAMIQWAFRQPDVAFVEAETDPENKASQRILEKCGFQPDGTGIEGPRFVLESPITNWIIIYMLFGISIGTSLGQLQNQMLFGMALGIGLGFLVGEMLNNSAKKNREALRQQRKS